MNPEIKEDRIEFYRNLYFKKARRAGELQLELERVMVERLKGEYVLVALAILIDEEGGQVPPPEPGACPSMWHSFNQTPMGYMPPDCLLCKEKRRPKNRR